MHIFCINVYHITFSISHKEVEIGIIFKTERNPKFVK